jgi:2-polyprenyl-3-methyl-5-hydroxy-6-metoxy-1,4-benzoquinol methylase
MFSLFSRQKNKKLKINRIDANHHAVTLLNQHYSNGLIDKLSDDALATVNNALAWNAFTVDSMGRILGRAYSHKKRHKAQLMPDPRILKLADSVQLKGTRVLEIGCFEGIHTLGLSMLGANVVGIDARPENILKAQARAYLYSQSATFEVVNVENSDLTQLGIFQGVFSCGVLYHLANPFQHLKSLSAINTNWLYLDTHVKSKDDKTVPYTFDNKVYKAKKYIEFGLADVFSGINKYSHWVSTEDLMHFLRSVGYSKVELIEVRNERNGERVAILARK